MSNTTQNLPCVLCGAPGNIVREAPNQSDVRVKCSSCGHTYSKMDSLDAQAAHQIPEYAGPAPEPAYHPEQEVMPPSPEPSRSQNSTDTGTLAVPRTPAFVFVSKDRKTVEFCTKKDLKRKALQWETTGKTYDMFELLPKKVSAKIEFN